jgi:hypothetical protein
MTIKANEPSDFPRLRPELEASALELAGVGEPDVREIRTWMCAALLADATPHQLENAAKLLDAVAAKDSRARDVAAVEAAAAQLRGKLEEGRGAG